MIDILDESEAPPCSPFPPFVLRNLRWAIEFSDAIATEYSRFGAMTQHSARETPKKSPGTALAAPGRQSLWASSLHAGLQLVGCPGVAICRSSERECRQGYATTLLSSVKRS
jgi:hypothetical protein